MQVDLDKFWRDMMLEAFSSVSAQQWRERAKVFRAARPRPGDFTGRSTLEERRERWRRLTAMAEACEAHADVIAGTTRAGSTDTLAPELAAFSIWGDAA